MVLYLLTDLVNGSQRDVSFRLIVFSFFLVGCTGDEKVTLNEQPDWLIYNKFNSPLPDNQVHALAIDDRGVKWIGTANGLARFVGTSWVTYDTTNSALPSNFITSVAVTDQGIIWIGTNKGLAFYNGSTWALQNNLNDEFITKLFYDGTREILWVGTDRGLCSYDGIRWDMYDDPETSLLDVYVSSLHVDKNGILWLGSFDHYSFVGRLLKFDGLTWTSFRLDERGIPSSFPDALVVDRGNVIWMGVKGTMGGMLVRIQGENWEIFNSVNTGCRGLAGGINALALANDGTWIASGSGLTTYDGSSWRYFDTTNSGLPDNFTTSIVIDDQGRKWVGTITEGLAMLR